MFRSLFKSVFRQLTGQGQHTYPKGLGRQEPNGSFNPNGPRRNAVYKGQWEIGRSEAAVSFALPSPFSRHPGR
jgi:hypothetical protein